MPDEQPLDPREWPRWFHHVALASVLCATPDEAADLPAGYRKEPTARRKARACEGPARGGGARACSGGGAPGARTHHAGHARAGEAGEACAPAHQEVGDV